MVKTLLLMRHAEAPSLPALRDFDRPLSARGEAMARDVAKGLVARGHAPEKIICSSALRTRQTCELVATGLDKKPEVAIEPRFYGGDADLALDEVRAGDDAFGKLMIVGHNPWIHIMALTMAAEGELAKHGAMKSMYPPSSCAIFTFAVESWRDIAKGRGQIADYFFSMG